MTTDSVLRPWPRPRPAVYDLAEAWDALEGARRAGWHPEMRYETDHGWVWTATRLDGRRLRTVVRAASRDPAVAIAELVRLCEEHDDPPPAHSLDCLRSLPIGDGPLPTPCTCGEWSGA